VKFRKGLDFEQLARWYTFGAAAKYRTLRGFEFGTPFRPDRPLEGKLGQVGLDEGGRLRIARAYTWDGASGPTFDTPATMRASLVHDALYQLMRERNLDASVSRAPADELLREIMLVDGARPCRAEAWLWAVRRFAASAARA
jgi:hypothetical protein